ncbi:PLP-dependent aminotransferase family protein [Paenibacillus sp. CAU 1782]
MTSYNDYPPVPGINTRLFQLGENALPVSQFNEALNQLKVYTSLYKSNFLGYQANQALNYKDDLGDYLNLHLNNIGDPFQSGNFMLNTKWIERAVLDYFAKLWNAKAPHDDKDGESYWGYVVSMGGTEGNLYGLRNARDYLSGKLLASDIPAKAEGDSTGDEQPVQLRSKLYQGLFLKPQEPNGEGGSDGGPDREYTAEDSVEDNANAYIPILFYSEDTHYSIDKIKDLLLLPTFSEYGKAHYPGQSPLGGDWPEKVPSNADGSINLELLKTLVQFFASKGHPIAVNFNFGTTFKGEYDQVEKAVNTLLPILKANNLFQRDLKVVVGDKTVISQRNGFWFHVDGALGAAYMPFLEIAKKQGRYAGDVPVFDFRTYIHSISVSGHKEIGAPWPTGVYLSKTKYLLNFVDVSYVGARDSTLSGSRNGFSALLLWHYFAKRSYADQVDKAVGLENLAQRAYQELQVLQQTVWRKLDLHVDRSPGALTVRFLRPNPSIVTRFSLSTEQMGGVSYAHIFIMEHVTDVLILRLIDALKASDAFDQPKAAGDAYTHEQGLGFK